MVSHVNVIDNINGKSCFTRNQVMCIQSLYNPQHVTVRTDRPHKRGGWLITLIRNNIPTTINQHNTKLQLVKVDIAQNTSQSKICALFLWSTLVAQAFQTVYNTVQTFQTDQRTNHSRHHQQLSSHSTQHRTPTRVPNTRLPQPSSPDITTVSITLYDRASCITKQALTSDHLPMK